MHPVRAAVLLSFLSKSFSILVNISPRSCLKLFWVSSSSTGHGNTHPIPLPIPSQRIDFIKLVLQALQLKHPVLVSPSISGYYSLPLVMEQPELLSGYVSISPSGADGGGKTYNAAQYQQNHVSLYLNSNLQHRSSNWLKLTLP